MRKTRAWKGITASAFTGKAKDYPPDQKALYQLAQSIAVTTYSSLFNTNPFFGDADLLIFDDAHSGEGYVASNWTVHILKSDHHDLYFELLDDIKTGLEPEIYERLLKEDQNSDLFWVDKVPNIKLLSCCSKVQETITRYILSNQDTQIKYAWSMICEHIKACNMFISPLEIILRPFIPPTMQFSPFTEAKQRLYMSATLGKSAEAVRCHFFFGVAHTPKSIYNSGVTHRPLAAPGSGKKIAPSTGQLFEFI